MKITTEIIEKLLEKPMAFYPIYARFLGDVNKAVYIQHLIECNNPLFVDSGKFIATTAKFIEKETGLSKTAQNHCREIFIANGWLETTEEQGLNPNEEPIFGYRFNKTQFFNDFLVWAEFMNRDAEIKAGNEETKGVKNED
jgi:hypothetical protein